jgi:transposase
MRQIISRALEAERAQSQREIEQLRQMIQEQDGKIKALERIINESNKKRN